MNIIAQLKAAFPDCWFKDGHEFDGGEAAVWSGEGSEVEDLPAFNADSYMADPKEQVWVMGVHHQLNSFVESRGYHWEAYDSGTYLLYKD